MRFRQIGVTMPLENKTELFWQAFRYVGDEMTPAEASEFEAELADQQTAREAVARVVELSQLVLAAAPEESPIEIFVTPVRHSQAWITGRLDRRGGGCMSGHGHGISIVPASRWDDADGVRFAGP